MNVSVKTAVVQEKVKGFINVLEDYTSQLDHVLRMVTEASENYGDDERDTFEVMQDSFVDDCQNIIENVAIDVKEISEAIA